MRKRDARRGAVEGKSLAETERRWLGIGFGAVVAGARARAHEIGAGPLLTFLEMTVPVVEVDDEALGRSGACENQVLVVVVVDVTDEDAEPEPAASDREGRIAEGRGERDLDRRGARAIDATRRHLGTVVAVDVRDLPAPCTERGFRASGARRSRRARRRKPAAESNGRQNQQETRAREP